MLTNPEKILKSGYSHLTYEQEFYRTMKTDMQYTYGKVYNCIHCKGIKIRIEKIKFQEDLVKVQIQEN